MKIEIIVDVSKIEDSDIEFLKKIAIKSQDYPSAVTLSNYQKHCAAVLEINNNQVK